jgi:hypothetical protein
MFKRAFLIISILIIAVNISDAQVFIKTSDLFPVTRPDSKGGELNIIQDQRADTLMSRYILANRFLKGGMEGYRIQIFRNSTRTAREESNKVRADFMVLFPDITSYIEYAEPGWFLVKVGDFRTKMEGTKSLYMIRKKYPNAYLVPSIINFPDLKKD